MLKLKAALVSLVLGSSSVALASPGVTFTANAQAQFSFGPQMRDHRAPQYGMPTQSSWIQLAPAALLKNGRTTIRPELARISTLRLQAGRGMTYVQSVELRFRNGTYQSLPVNRWLTSTIDLSVRTGRAIDTITVIGSANRSSTYLLYAQGARTEQPQPPVYQPPIYQPLPPVYQAPPVVASAPYTLGQNMAFSGGARVMNVGSIKGAFNTLRLEGAGAGAFIAMVEIDFSDGTRQFQNAVNKPLANAEVFDIALDGLNPRSVERVVVWTNEGRAIYGANDMISAALL